MTDPVLRLLSEKHHGRYNWVFVADWNIQGYTIPQGFVTDLGSIPHIFWSLVGPAEIAHAALIHDYHYVVQDIPRKQADKELKENVQTLDHIGPIRARLIYWAVRLGGRYR